MRGRWAKQVLLGSWASLDQAGDLCANVSFPNFCCVTLKWLRQTENNTIQENFCIALLISVKTKVFTGLATSFQNNLEKTQVLIQTGDLRTLVSVFSQEKYKSVWIFLASFLLHSLPIASQFSHDTRMLIRSGHWSAGQPWLWLPLPAPCQAQRTRSVRTQGTAAPGPSLELHLPRVGSKVYEVPSSPHKAQSHHQKGAVTAHKWFPAPTEMTTEMCSICANILHRIFNLYEHGKPA